MDCGALQLFLCWSYSKSILCKPRELQALILPMPAEEAVPEWGQELLCWVIALRVKRAPAQGGTEKEGSAPTQVK